MTTPAYFDVVISIINFRTKDLTINCIQSVLADMDGINGHIVVVDNASGDGSAEAIEDWLTTQAADVPVTLVKSATNSGFSGGHNQGMRAYPAHYYLVLNSDAVLRPGFLQKIIATAKEQPEAGFVAPRLEGDDGHVQVSKFRYQSVASEFIRGAVSGPVTRLLRRHTVALPQDAPIADIQWVSFACVLLQGRMVTEIGPMDEGYFLYFEDAEYCLRGRRAGWTIALAPDAVAVHFRGGSGPVKTLEKERQRLPAYFYSSRSRFLYQAHGQTGLIAANMAWHLGRVIAQFKRLFGKPVYATVAHEARDIWINAFQPLGPRRAPGE